MTFGDFLAQGLSYFVRQPSFYQKYGDWLMMLCIGGLVLLSAAAGYFCGCFNTAIVVSKRIYGIDIREKGSLNAGMTNMFRTFGKQAGFLTLAGDVAKTAIAVGLGYVFLGYSGAWLAGLFCVLGHMFPFCYRFRGGKGVLVAAVMLLLTDWPVFLLCILAFAVVLLGTRMVSLASIMTALVMPLFLDVVYKVFYSDGAVAGIRVPIAVVITVLIVLGHKENMKRIQAGKEPKIRFPWNKD